MREDKELLSICPMTNYKTPDYPILEYANDDASFLKKLPQRWKKSAAVFICIGLLGTSSLSGCSSIDEGNMVSDYEQVDIINFGNSDLDVRTHHGGSGGGSFYVVHLTEQEALGFIRAQLEAAGLNLNAALPSHEDSNGWVTDFAFFDEERGVAIIFHGEENWRWGFSVLEEIDEEFLKQHNINTIGEFFIPGVIVGRGLFAQMNARRVSSRQSSSQRTTLYEDLASQVQMFITQLRTEGIL